MLARPVTTNTSAAFAVLLAVACLVAGCASYTAAPIDVPAVAAEQRAVTIDLDAVRAELARIAPAYEWRNDEWNRLTLFAAGLTTNPNLARARAAALAARAEAAAARIAPGPTLTLTAEYAFNPTEASHWLYGVASDLLLDRGGRRQGRIDAADVAVRVAAFDYGAAIWSLRMGVRRALDARSTWRTEATLASELVALRQRQFEAVSRRVAAGEVSRLELDRVRADAANDAKTQATARASIVRAGLDLAAALGVPIEAIDLDRIVPFGTEDPVPVPPITDEQMAFALQARTEILAAAAAYDRAEAALKITVASQYPQLSVGPGYTWERGLRKLPFALGLAIPSRDRGRATIAAAEARRAEAARQLEAAVAAVTASISQSDADYRAALTVLDLVRNQTLPTARALAEQADREFAAGSIDRADWAASQAGLLTAELDEIVAVRSVLQAEGALEDALRQPLRGPEIAIGSNLTTPPKDDAP